MVFSKKWNIRLALFSIFAGLMISMALWNGAPTLTQAAPNGDSFIEPQGILRQLIIVMAPTQRVELRDADGNVWGSGKFRAKVSGHRDGRASGQAELDELGSINVHFHWDFTEWEETQDGGVLLKGRGRATFEDGHIEMFQAMVKVRKDLPTTSVPECLIWDIPGAPVLDGLNFDTERSRLTFKEQ